MQRLWAGLLLPLVAIAAEPSAADQTAMQDVLRRYLRGVNDCDGAAINRTVTKDFTVRGILSGFVQPATYSLNQCSAGKPAFEIAALARLLNRVTDNVTVADAFFRTIGMPGGEQAGRLYITFAKDAEWRIFSLRFHPYRFESPLIAVQPAERHDASGPDGWVTLFDGTSTDALQDASGDAFPAAHWKVEDGALRAIAGQAGRGLRTRDTFRSFELRFEWKAPPQGNSGIKYRLFYLLGIPGSISDGAGFEYQVADDTGDPGAIAHPAERSGSLYNQIAARGAIVKPLGEYNRSAVIVRGRNCEHWLNGVKVVEFAAESNPPESPLVIQHHSTDMWFRNIRIRRLD
jgi:hypothetical protein